VNRAVNVAKIAAAATLPSDNADQISEPPLSHLEIDFELVAAASPPHCKTKRAYLRFYGIK